MRRLFAAILAVAVVLPLLLAALLALSVSSWALNPEFYVAALSNERLYEAALQQWRAHPDTGVELPPLPGLTDVPPQALGLALREALTPTYLRSQALSLVRQAFDALEAGSASERLHLDLAPLKQALAGEAGARFARKLAESLPVCTGSTGLPAGAGLPSCRPQGVSADRLAQLIGSRLPALLAGVPDTYLLPQEATPEGSWRGLPLGRRSLLWASVVLALIAAGFWIGAAFLAASARSERRGILAWLGVMLAVPAVLTLLIGLGVRLAWFGSGPWFTRRLPGWLDGTSEASRRTIEALAESSRPVLAWVGRGFLTAGGVAAGIAAGLIVWSCLSPKGDGQRRG